MIGAEVLSRLEGVAASTGSACHAGRVELSPVLTAMGVPEKIGMGAVRFSLGRATTGAEMPSWIGFEPSGHKACCAGGSFAAAASSGLRAPGRSLNRISSGPATKMEE